MNFTNIPRQEIYQTLSNPLKLTVNYMAAKLNGIIMQPSISLPFYKCVEYKNTFHTM